MARSVRRRSRTVIHLIDIWKLGIGKGSQDSLFRLSISFFYRVPHHFLLMNIGDKAPEFLGLNEKGEEIRLSNYKGRKIVLYFYPKDMTSGCTAQACNLRDNYEELRKQGYEVIGVSINDQKSHQKFIEKNSLPFTLIADTEQKLVQEFGVWGEKSMYGRKYMGTFRTTFIINEEGIIERIILPKEIKTKDHAAQILK